MSHPKYLIEVMNSGRLYEGVRATISTINALDGNGKPLYYLVNMPHVGTIPRAKSHTINRFRIIENEDAKAIESKYKEIQQKHDELSDLIRASKRRKPKASDFPDHPHPEHQVKRIRVSR